MTFRQFVIFILIFTGLMWAGWAYVLLNINPELTNFVGFFFFYTTLLLALSGTISLLTLYHRRQKHPQAVVFYLVSLSFRQGLIIAVLVTTLLLLQGLHWLTWWNLPLLLAAATGLEVLFLRKKKHFHEQEMSKSQFERREI